MVASPVACRPRSRGFVIGLINGVLIAYVGLSPFVVTLGMLSIARSCAVVLSGNRMLYEFGPGGPAFKISAAARTRPRRWPFSLVQSVSVSDHSDALFGARLKMTAWGRHIFAIGGNEQAANLTGVPVKRVKVQAYVVSGCRRPSPRFSASAGRARPINALGTAYELLAIASAVIGGANLMGGEGERLWRLHRLGADLRDPQFAADGGRRFQLAGNIRRQSSSSSRSSSERIRGQETRIAGLASAFANATGG